MTGYILETPRCYIREITEADIAAEFKLYDSPHMTDFIPPLSDPGTEVSLCKEYAAKVYDVYGYGMWGIFDCKTDRLIGEVGLEPRADTDRTKYPYDWMFDDSCAELGFMIAEDLWGQGYCTEVCRAILDHCRKHFGITEVFARTVPENTASLHVLAALGFEEYGSDDGAETAQDENGSVKIYRIHLGNETLKVE